MQQHKKSWKSLVSSITSPIRSPGGLREKKSRTVGVIFNDLSNPFYTEIIGEIGERLNEADYSLIICYSHYDLERERRNITSLISHRVDGIIISPIDEKSPNIELLAQNHVQTVIIDNFPHASNLSYVYTDHGIGIRLATEHLIDKGHRNILLITAPAQEASRADRFTRGFIETLQAHGIEPRSELIVLSKNLSIESGSSTFRALVEASGGPARLGFTGVVAISDLLAVGIYKTANELALRIPEDFSIVGYDNIEVTSALSPPLTTIHQSRRRIGAESVKILINNMESSSPDVRRLSFNPHLVERKSVRAL